MLILVPFVWGIGAGIAIGAFTNARQKNALAVIGLVLAVLAAVYFQLTVSAAANAPPPVVPIPPTPGGL